MEIQYLICDISKKNWEKVDNPINNIGQLYNYLTKTKVVKSPPAMQETSPGPGRPYVPWDKQALTPQVLSPRTTTAAAVPSKPVPAPRAQPKEKPALHNQRAAPVAVTRENPVQQRRSSLAKNKINF